VLKDSPAQVLLPKWYPKIRLTTVANSDKGVEGVASGKLVAFVNVLPALVYAIQKQGLTNVKISGTLPSSVRLSMLVNRDHPELVSILNRVIDTITAHERQMILNKWVQVKYENVVSNKIWKAILLLFLFLFLLMAAWHYHTVQIKSRLQEQYRALTMQMERELAKNRHQQLLLLQQNRFSQKGEIINMIAHQWRQPLNTLSLLVQTFVLRYKSGHSDIAAVEKFGNDTKNLIRQMSDTIDDFRNFFTTDKEAVIFQLSEVISHALSLVQPVLEREGIRVELACSATLSLRGMPNELGQALINLLNNAKDALRAKKSGDKYIEIFCKEEGDETVIYVTDNGGGIPEEILPHIFDPYFTTKKDGHGTGIGLYMSRIIIEEHMHGKLEVYNHEEGARFAMRMKTAGV